MGAKATIEHISKGWIEIFTSSGMQDAVDSAGERIAAEAGEHFSYAQGQKNRYTVAGFVGSDDYEGALLEAEDKVLTKAVHR